MREARVNATGLRAQVLRIAAFEAQCMRFSALALLANTA
jgi:hypothetical protein